jgi:hypothetical protein
VWAYGAGSEVGWLVFRGWNEALFKHSFDASKGFKALRDFIEFSILARIVFGIYVWITHSRISVPLVVIVSKLGYDVHARLAFAPSLCPE